MDCAYVINLDWYISIGTHWIHLYLNGDRFILITLELNIFQKKLKIS